MKAPPLWRDPHGGAAFAVALPVWAASLWLWGAPTVWPSAQVLLLTVLVYPLLEEIVFRGALQTALLERCRGRRAGLSDANLITSLVFTALHLLVHAQTWAVLVFFPSLIFGHLRERHARLWPSQLLHVYYNTGWVLCVA